MKLVAIIAAVILMAGLGTCNVKAQPSGNLVSPNLIGSGYSTITGTTPYTGTGGGYSGGSTPGYNSSTNTIHFGYTQSTVAYTYAFSQALQNSGMTILGYNYSWDYLNQNPYNGTLSAAVNFVGTSGASLHSKAWTLGTTTDWTNVNGTETFVNNGLAASSIANFSLSFSGRDARFWAGYYGPQVRNPSLSLNYTFDQCSTDPLSSPSCPGYAAAYLTQQCTANPLYNTACPGYAAAYQIQQCTINPLSDPSCPGYASAYLTYQCSINPLYSTTCSGYQQAYHDQQCSINPLYATDCMGYAAAYKSQQCSLNGLYDRSCPNYSEAYAKKMLLEQQNLASTVATAGVVAQTAPTTTTTTASTTSASTTVSSDGTVSTGVSKTGDTNVDKAITSTTTTANASAAPAAPVQLAAPAPAAAPQQQAQQEKKPEGGEKKPEGGPTTQMASPQQEQGGSKDQPRTARQELQERRQAAAKAEAIEKGKNLANEMGKASDLEAQKAVQNVVIQAMGFTPGFDSYSKTVITDTIFYKPHAVYTNQQNVDNRRLGRGLFGPTDQLHNQMVEQQYESR